jgi:MFS transporter, SP family, arabinose:H+ symporter
VSFVLPTEPHEEINPAAKGSHLYVYAVCAIAALGGILFGFDMVIISGAVPFFRQVFQLNETETGWAVGCINLGAAIGAVLAGKLSGSIGRKKSLLFCGILFALTGVMTGWSENFVQFITFRMLGGVAVGVAALVCPMYIAEVAPASIRGRLVTLYQLAIVSGLLLAYVSNYFLLGSGENNWRWMFTSQTIPSILFLAGLMVVPESPRWLIKKKRIAESLHVLKRIGGDDYAQVEHARIEKSFFNEIQEKSSALFRPDVRFIVLTGAIVAIFSQAVGQNSLFSYSAIIFQEAGVASETAFLQSIILGLTNFVFTFIAIAFIDKAGRRKLLLIGSALLCADALALMVCFYFNVSPLVNLVFVLLFIAIYAATLGPVTWVLLSEIFPNRIRGNAMSVATVCLWIANFFTTASFPIMKDRWGLSIVFLIHGVICLVYFVFVTSTVPETKGKSLEEIEKELVRNH